MSKSFRVLGWSGKRAYRVDLECVAHALEAQGLYIVSAKQKAVADAVAALDTGDLEVIRTVGSERLVDVWDAELSLRSKP